MTLSAVLSLSVSFVQSIFQVNIYKQILSANLMDAKPNGILTYCKAATNDECFAAKKTEKSHREENNREKGRKTY